MWANAQPDNRPAKHRWRPPFNAATEIILRDTASEMQHVADAMMEWSDANHMNVNVKKTKKMVLGRFGKESVTPVTMTANPLQQVS